MSKALKDLEGKRKDFIKDLALLENEIARIKESVFPVSFPLTYMVNPVLNLTKVSWRNLPDVLNNKNDSKPEPGDEYVIIWKNPGDGKVYVKSADNEDLLALKLIAEGHDLKRISEDTKTPLSFIKETIKKAVNAGLIIRPESKIRRSDDFWLNNYVSKEYLISDTFTLQWHITQTCDLNCRHCYDRTDRKRLTFSQAIKVLEDMDDFCERMNVDACIFFTGGNPFLHPCFFDIYKEAVKRGFEVAILGNPVPIEKLKALIKIKKPSFYQVSLEGLEAYNDYIRGKGHFKKTMEFLQLLNEQDIYSVVMLTLTRDNMDQIIPLAERLSNLVDSFTFNRLSLVGKGASLYLPEKDHYIGFLEDYMENADGDDILKLKDNLLNILKFKHNEELFGGCTGFGCGAGFNFVALTPDGEVHACRKFPSLIGNIFDRSLIDIYTSSEANRYRKAPLECSSCPIRAVCRGCLAVAYSFGLDVFKDKDPFCFINQA